MDAQVAYGFHHLRNEKPYLAQGPISNKVWLNMAFQLCLLIVLNFLCSTNQCETFISYKLIICEKTYNHDFFKD